MLFSHLKDGESVFLDANTLVYQFQPHPIHGGACSRLLARIEQQQVAGFTSTHVLSEVAHRLMMIEASALPGWTASKIKLRLRQQPVALSQLMHFRLAIETVLQSRIVVLTIAPSTIAHAAVISIVALMQLNGISNIASSDADFDRVPGITRYAPS